MFTRIISSRPTALAILILMVLADAALTGREALARAGSGQSYRSSSSSSSSRSSSSSSSSSDRSSSSSTYRSTTTPSRSSSSSSSSSSSTSSSSHSSGPGYTDDYSINSFSAAMIVNRDATVDVTETFDVTLRGEHAGIRRTIDLAALGSIVTLAGAVSPQGYADEHDSCFSFGYKGRGVTGRQVFVLKYRVTGAVLPHGAGARFLWRTLMEKNSLMGTITVSLPAGVIPTAAKAITIPPLRGNLHRQTELACAIAGSEVRIPLNRIVTSTVDIAVTLPAGAVDGASLEKALASANDTWNDVRVGEYRTRVVMRNDRTMERADEYRAVTGIRPATPDMRSARDYVTNAVDDASTDDRYISVRNNLYLYGFDKKKCPQADDYTSCCVCVPFDDPAAKERRASLRYTMWGNFNPGEPLFFDLRIPAAEVNRVDTLRAEIVLPAGVKPEQVQPRVYLLRKSVDSFIMVHQAVDCHRWEGNTLVIEYPAGLYQGQYLLARLYAPATAFTSPGWIARLYIFFSYHYHFNGTALFAAIFLIVLLAAAGVAVPVILKKRKKGGSSAAAVPAAPGINVDQSAVDTIRSEDPAFDPAVFMERVRTIAGAIQDAWGKGDMAPVRNFVSQGIYNRFRLQLRLLREQDKTVNLMGDFRVHSLIFSKVSLSKAYHTAHVSVGAAARDITVPVDLSDEQKAGALGGASVNNFFEVYSFTRKRGAKTDTAKNIYAGQCPSCGTIPPKFGDTNKCPSCGSIYNSGEFDWVLSEITQAEEWKDTSANEVPGLAALEGEGLSINRGVIEDRASYLFWRWLACRAAGSAAALSRDATAKFLGGFTPAAGYLGSAAVGAVDLREVTAAGDELRATVLALWSAAPAPGSEPRHHEHLLHLALPRQQKNPYGLADHSCDSCGAPLPESDALKCAYCSSDLQKVNSDWLLDGVAEHPAGG